MPRKPAGPQPIDFEPVPYPLTGGVDTKFHGLVLPPPKLQTCENAFVDQTGSIQRRSGRTALTTLDTGGNTISTFIGANASYQGRLISFTPDRLYDYSSATSRWVDGGRATSWRERTTAIDAGDIRSTVSPGAKDVAIINSYRCYAYENFETSGANLISRVMVTLVDATGIRYTTGKILATVTAAAASASSVRVVAHGSLFYVVYWDVNSAGDLKCFTIDTTSAATIATSLAASPTTLAANLGLAGGGLYAPLDLVENIVHGPFVCYRSTAANTIAFGHITSAGALTHTSTASSGAASCLTIACDVIFTAVNTMLHGIVFTLGTAPNDVYALLRSYNGTAWTVTASSGAMDTALAGALTRAVACKFDSVTTFRVFYDNDTNISDLCIRQGTYTTAGVIASQVDRLNHSYLASRPFAGADGATYIWVQNSDFSVQPTLFLMKIDGTLAGVANQGVAAIPGLQAYAIGHVPSDATAKSFSLFTHYYTRFGASGVGATGAMRDITVDMSHVQSHVCIEDGGCLYIPSAFMQEYDGVSCTEAEFLVYVDTQNTINLGAAASTAGAGALTSAAGTIYGYRVVPEWTNAQGEREVGTDNGPKATAAFALGDNTVTFTVPTIPWTLKQAAKGGNPRRQNIVFAVYRTLANPTADSPHYRVGTVQNDPTLDTVTFVDLMSDAVAATQEQLKADTELDSVAPPPGYILAAGNGRVFMAGLADDPNLVVYTKQRSHGEPLAFNDILQIPFPATTGAITGLAVMNDSLLAFCEGAIYRVNGPGINNTGLAGGFTDPILVATNDGAVGPRSVVITPDGVMFDSSARGISLVPPSMAGVVYVGAPLEKLSAPGTCSGAVVVAEAQQVRFTFATVTYVYDYYHRQWYVFTFGSQGPSAAWNGVHASNGAYDDPAVWTDATVPYTMELVLGFVTAPTSRRSDIAVRALGLTGVSLAAHNLAVYVRYDLGKFNGTVIETSVAGAGVLEPKWRLARPRCSSIEVTIRDALLDQYGFDVVQNTAGMKLNELVLEMGIVTPHLGREV